MEDPIRKLAPDLAAAVLARNQLIASGARLTDFVVMALDKRAGILAADLKAACEEPQAFRAWEPAHPRNAG